MILFRILCGILLAWAANWALHRPEAHELLIDVPEMEVLGPIAAVAVGAFSLAVRQGWGAIVGFANGVWAGVLSIALSGTLYTLIKIVQAMRTGLIHDFDNFLNVFGDTVEPLIGHIVNPPLVIVSLGAAAIIGVVTEMLHWLLVRFRRKRHRPRSS